ncbi:glycosyltransferase family 2 protein [Xanthobacter sp. TB0139]|uniref:glycosyltransferase family 2 protein n=1 Tax=Xanthobacter sp. TB0139 TaxID=3459178 RepID=UPI00403A4391
MEHSFEPSSRMNASDKMVKMIGRDLLGPVVHRWLLGLHQHISYFDDGQTSFLFCARAGVRIQKLYEIFLRNFSSGEPLRGNMLWASRLSTAKGTFTRASAPASRLIASEYTNQPIQNLICGVFRHHPEILSNIDLNRPEYLAHGKVFPGWIQAGTPAAVAMRDYFQTCSKDFDQYISGLIGSNRRAVIIDSGWRGTIQTQLATAFPEIIWNGLYFGRYNPPQDSNIAERSIGILFEGETYVPSKPETSFARHRHIIETLLEPNGPSIEEIPDGEYAALAAAQIEKNLNEVPDEQDDALYLHVIDYLEGEGKTASVSDIFARHQEAMRELSRIIITPRREEALSLLCKDRSADFGKELTLPVLLEPGEGAEADERIKQSLWPEGQIALEYEGGYAKDLQLRISGGADALSYFDPNTDGAGRQEETPSVAIITRTKNRPLLLRRAAESVAQQTYQNFIWVIVNDGGDETPVIQVINECRVDRRKIMLVSNNKSLGMEAASNAGIRNSKSDLVVIHDDDDSWEPQFLAETAGFLASKRGERYGGVISGTTYVSEEIRGNTVTIYERKPYMSWVRNVQLSEMSAGNMFAPISFVFRRTIWEDINGYNESLPVLGDWFFNMEFLLRADIGVIDQPLANYHHRDRGESSAYANSVIGGRSKHEEYAAIARNEFVRKNMERFPSSVAAVLAYFACDFRSQMREISTRLQRVEVEGHSSVPARVVSKDNTADKYWAVLHINQNLMREHLLTGRANQLNPLISWEDLEHFLRINRNIHVPIPPDFDEIAYLQLNPDVAATVGSPEFLSGYRHYLMHGCAEGRERPPKIGQ